MHTLKLARVGLLLRHQALLYARKTFIWLAPAALVLLLTAYTSRGADVSGSGAPFFAVWYGLLVGLGGFFVACQSLRENRTADGRQSFLTLPASDAEKWLAIYLWSGPIFLVVLTAGYWVVTLIVNALLGAFGLAGFAPFTPFGEDAWWAVSFYLLIVHPVGLLGAITFDTWVEPKTTGVLLAAMAGLGLVAAVAFRVVFHEAFDGLFAMRGPVEFADGNPFAIDPVWGFGHVAETLFALVLLAAAYFRFHEKEV